LKNLILEFDSVETVCDLRTLCYYDTRFEALWTVTVTVAVLCAVTPVGWPIDNGSFERRVGTCIPMCTASHFGRRQLSGSF
jgi:hypothetical protein